MSCCVIFFLPFVVMRDKERGRGGNEKNNKIKLYQYFKFLTVRLQEISGMLFILLNLVKDVCQFIQTLHDTKKNLPGEKKNKQKKTSH